MSIKKLLLISAAISTSLFLNACSGSNYQPTVGGSQVQFIEDRKSDV